ncbi:cupin domain-containing protein [Affinibrenneria salicis]|uniref:Cupin domain-containing protein n=1 Tax=Affinibrenneria salicis TaxID=2590031 RepID=A0A5J5G5Z6_9GAMM|nr:cupin domain-containing protein [Affinibrenneria salicis]KAA9001886.1 cupin domain-containing protein [Affinibrenneria salicis]
MEHKHQSGFITPPDHIHFLAKKLFGNVGEISDGAIAYLEKGGGGPTEQHTHTHSHLFVVVSGKAKILLAEQEVVLEANESYLVDGAIPHSVWNAADETTVMLGISVAR